MSQFRALEPVRDIGTCRGHCRDMSPEGIGDIGGDITGFPPFRGEPGCPVCPQPPKTEIENRRMKTMTDKNSNRFPPSISAAKLYERTSAKGNPYLIGRWGNLRVAILKTQDRDDDGNAIWEMRFSAAPAVAHQKPRETPEPSSDTREPTYTAVDPEQASESANFGSGQRRRVTGFANHVDDEIPF